jgi:integrase
MCLQVKEDAKTDASSNRLVPIAATLNQRVDLAAIPAPNKDDEGQAVGKRFGRLKSKLGFGSLKVFHSIRKTATTVFEQAGVSEGTTADIVGHEKGTITYGLYSGGTSIDQRKSAVDAFEALMLRTETEAFNERERVAP